MTKHQHYKGGIYTLITFAQHTETGDDLVIYQNERGEVFARPHDMFFEDVVVDGDSVPRFREMYTPGTAIPVKSVRDGKTEIMTINAECQICRGLNNNLNKKPNLLIKIGASERYVCDICVEDFIHNPVVADKTKESVAYFNLKQKGNYMSNLLRKYGRNK